MKRFTLSVVVTAILALAAYTLAGAQAAGQQERQGPGRGFGIGAGRGPGGPGGRGAMMMLRDVDLTDQQKEEIQAILKDEREGRQGPPADAALQRQLQAELYADNPDPQKLESLQQQLVQAEAARLAKRIEIEQKVAAVLTAEQRAQVREKLAKGPQERERRRGPAR
jgi:Spy/CpxP family protein refolding chaperone